MQQKTPVGVLSVSTLDVDPDWSASLLLPVLLHHDDHNICFKSKFIIINNINNETHVCMYVLYSTYNKGE